MSIVTRFAPSPTGHLHIGGARTAAFCWLLSKHFKGKFVLRIEDTDTERSLQEYTDSILASMNWLGLVPDEPPLYQTKRFDIYNEYIDKLLATGHAYWCECSTEKVEAMREKARATGQKPRYDGSCRNLGLGAGVGRVVRLAAPTEGRVVFEDMVKGHIAFDVNELDDMILRRSDGAPTYNLAVVVDDITMNITHVIRGDDHVNNTPKQILLYQALGATLPVFGHVPMILGADRQKLSKRHGAKAVIEYEKDGLLPEALVNYLVRLGWSHGDQEIFTMQQLVEFFDGTSLNSSAAAFDPDKLLWVNAQHMRSLSPQELLPRLMPFLEREDIPSNNVELILLLIPLFLPRTNTLVEMAEQMRPLLQNAESLNIEPTLLEKALDAEGQKHVALLKDMLQNLQDFADTSIHAAIQDYVATNSLKFKAVGQPLRISIMGTSGGPDLSAVIAALGKAETLARMTHALKLAQS